MNEAWMTTLAGVIGYVCAGVGFAYLTSVSLKRVTNKIVPILEQDAKKREEKAELIKVAFEKVAEELVEIKRTIGKVYEELDKRHVETFNSTLDEFASLEEKIVMVHQDILYFDQDLDDMEERVIRLEYRPVKGEPTTIDAQAIPSRVEMPLRRMKELRRRRRL